MQPMQNAYELDRYRYPPVERLGIANRRKCGCRRFVLSVVEISHENNISGASITKKQPVRDRAERAERLREKEKRKFIWFSTVLSVVLMGFT